MQKNKEIIDKAYNKLVYIVEIIIPIIMGVALYKVAYKYQDLNYISKPNMAVAIISGIILLAIIVINSIKYKKKIEKLFLTYVIPIGIMFTILLPMNKVPDEDGHMIKTYDVSQGHLITPFGEENKGDIYIPEQMQELIENRNELNYSKLHEYFMQKADYNTLLPAQTIAKTYAPVNYLTGAITFFICRILNINILLACYLGRLVNFLLFAIIGYYCIKILPFGKLLMAIYMLLPMIVQQAASLSADAFINAVSLLFIAYNLKLLYQEKDLDLKQKLIYYMLALSLALCKYVYFPLVFMSLMLIKNKKISKKNRNELIIVSTILAILAAVGWFVFSQKYVDVRKYIIESNVKPIEQLKYILLHPFIYVKILIKNFEANTGFYLFTFVGKKLGALDIDIPQIYAIIELFALLMIPFFEKNDKSLEKIQKWVMNLISIVLILLIITGLYLTWTPLQEPSISGVQGRYFVPAFILTLLTMINKKKNIEVKNLEIKYFALFLILNMISLNIIFHKFI